MKKINLIPVIIVYFLNCLYVLKAQDQKDIISSSFCDGFSNKSSDNDYRLGYSYRENESILIISGYLGNENCGIEHIFTANIDSNMIVLTEEIIDTLLTTCYCSKKIKIEIDSFFYEEFTVEFNGEFLADVPSDNLNYSFKLYPNPAKDFVKVDMIENSGFKEIELLDCNGRTIKTISAEGKNSVEFDLRDCKPGLYFLKTKSQTFSLIKN